MHNYPYLAVLVTALTVLVLGCINPKGLQARKAGNRLGHPAFRLLALAAATVGILCVCCCESFGLAPPRRQSRGRSRSRSR